VCCRLERAGVQGLPHLVVRNVLDETLSAVQIFDFFCVDVEPEHMIACLDEA